MASSFPLILPFPKADESLRVFPVEARFSFFRVHAHKEGRSPCVGGDCEMCQRLGRLNYGRWMGYIACVPAWAPKKVTLLEVTAGLWERCGDMHTPGRDLRKDSLVWTRMPGRGAPRMTLEVAFESDARFGENGGFPLCRDLLLQACHFPADLPDYRAEVYFHLVGRRWPSEDAEPSSFLELHS